MTYEEVLKEFAAKDERLIVMTAENRAAIRNLPPQLDKRFIDVGICEQTMVGAAAGLALRGRIPVIHALATFLTMRAFEFIRTDIGIANLPVKIVGGVPGFLSDGNGPTHQAIEDIALMRGIPNMEIFCPADGEELASMLPAILDRNAPCYIRYNASEKVVSHKSIEAGKAEVLSEGSDITLLTYGFLLKEAIKAKELLESKGLSVGLINVRWLSPFDVSTVRKAIASTNLTVTIEDHFLTGGLYSIIAEMCLKERISPRVMPIALDHKWFKPALLQDVLKYEGFTGAQLAERISKEFEKLND